MNKVHFTCNIYHSNRLEYDTKDSQLVVSKVKRPICSHFWDMASPLLTF